MSNEPTQILMILTGEASAVVIRNGVVLSDDDSSPKED